MNRRKVLLYLTFVMLTFGLGMAAFPFLQSFNPNAKAIAALPRIDISDIEIGQTKIVKLGVYPELWTGHEWSLFFYRTQSNELLSWHIPTRDGAVGMPDLQWWRPMYDCKEFGPTVVDGEVDESKPITCHDTDLPSSWWEEEWRWNISGSSLGSMVVDMYKATGSFEGKYFVYGKRS